MIANFFSEASGAPPGHQKRSLATLNEYFGNAVSEKKIGSRRYDQNSIDSY